MEENDFSQILAARLSKMIETDDTSSRWDFGAITEAEVENEGSLRAALYMVVLSCYYLINQRLLRVIANKLSWLFLILDTNSNLLICREGSAAVRELWMEIFKVTMQFCKQ